MKTVIQDMDSIQEGGRDTKTILGKKVKEKDKREATLQEFQIKIRLKGIPLEEKNAEIGKQGSRLQDNLLKREDNVEMVGGINQGNQIVDE